jgi:DNA-binding MarR family transcriptional regulator
VDDSDILNSAEIETIVDLDRRMMLRLRRTRDTAWLDIHLPLPALRALLTIERSPGITPGEIASYLQLARPTLSAILDRLEGDGLVEREVNPSDRRQFLFRATSQGHELSDRLDGHRRERLRQAFARMSPEELHALQGGLIALERILLELEQEDAAQYTKVSAN